MEHGEEGRRPWNPRLTAAVVLAVVVAAAVASFALYPRRGAAPPPTRTQPPVTVTASKVPPANRPLLWFRDSSDANTFVLRAVGWDGHSLGSLSVVCSACGVLASPDGQRLLIGSQSAPGHRSNQDRVFDVTGRLLAVVDGFQAMWSDDSRRLCALRAPSSASPTSNSVDLAITDVATRHTRMVGEISTPAASTAGAWTLASCSVTADRAVAEFFGAGVRALRV